MAESAFHAKAECLKIAFLIVTCIFPVAEMQAASDEADEDPEDPFSLLQGDVPIRAADNKFYDDVACSIGKGKAYLISIQKDNGSWSGCFPCSSNLVISTDFGCTALVLYALLCAGVAPHEDCIEKGFRYLRIQPLRYTSEVSLLAMAIAQRRRPPAPETSIHSVNELLEYWKWKNAKTALPTNEKALMEECTRFLMDVRMNSGVLPDSKSPAVSSIWGYPGAGGLAPDHANTVLALLALIAAERCGIRIPVNVWTTAIDHFVGVQGTPGERVNQVRIVRCNRDGADFEYFKDITKVRHTARGWCYRADAKAADGLKDGFLSATGSMTAAGIIALELALLETRISVSVKPESRRQAIRAVEDGFAWLHINWDLGKNPGHPDGLWHFFHLWGMKMAATLASRRAIGRHEWHRELAEFLVSSQKENGSWDDARCPGPAANTCFALLALR